VSTICACRLVNSAGNLANSAAATCGESCLDPVKVVASSCGASGNAETALRVSAFGWRHGERNFASPEFQPGEKSENKIAGKPMPSRRKKENYHVDDRQAKQEEKGFDAQR
jgi:hypothetical protein